MASRAAQRTYHGHASVNSPSRIRKARKIEEILSPRVDLRKVDVLDLGAGSGVLSAYLKPKVRRIVAADREPEIFIPTDVEVHRIGGSGLPFDDNEFDVVLFNHVIEHVGTRADQARILTEIRRVLRSDGILYLAAPSRLALIEPHYRLPFLSWLPQRLADLWVRRTSRNDWYDCNPFRHDELIKFLRDSGFEIEDVTAEAFFTLLRIEKAESLWGRALARVPESLVRLGTGAMPTFILLGRPTTAIDNPDLG